MVMEQIQSCFSCMLDDTLIEVISRLPLKSRARFMCVSKKWHHMITNSVSVANKSRALLYCKLKNGNLSFRCIDHEGYLENLIFPVEKNLLRFREVEICSSCQGLVLVRIDADLLIWNPLTKFFKKVLTCYHLLNDFWVVAGLCYDDFVNKYKVVVSTRSLTFHQDCFLVGTCGTNRWQRYRYGFKHFKVAETKSGPNFRGRVHWYYSKVYAGGHYLTHQIVYFLPKENKLRRVPMPIPKDRKNNNIIAGLGVLGGFLSMARLVNPNPNNFEGDLELLAMKEYGVRNSWTVMLIISNKCICRDSLAVPLYNTKYGSAMMYLHPFAKSLGIELYDANGNRLRGIFSSLLDFEVLNNVVAYEESLDSSVDLNWKDFHPEEVLTS